MTTEEITSAAISWLFRTGYSVAAEIGVGCYRGGIASECIAKARRLDLVGLKDDGSTIGVEVKATRPDLLGDRKMHLYHQWVERLYLAVPKDLATEGGQVAGSLKCGLLIVAPSTYNPKRLIADAVRRGTRQRIKPGAWMDLIMAMALRSGNPRYCPNCGSAPSQKPMNGGRGDQEREVSDGA